MITTYPEKFYDELEYQPMQFSMDSALIEQMGFKHDEAMNVCIKSSEDPDFDIRGLIKDIKLDSIVY